MRSTLSTFNEVWQQQFRAGVLKQVQQFPADTHFLIGCSGGVDSMLLLQLMSILFPQRVRALYVNHQLQQVSTAWGEFVFDFCQQHSIPCVIEAVQVAEGNLEQQARFARYQAFQKHQQVDEILVLGHHEQDQAETLLLRLFSGAGIHGLAAMQILDQREGFSIWRPFLNLSRTQIEVWADALDLPHIEDPTNTDTHYDRAWCREQLWPLLTERFPKMQQAIARTASLMQDAEQILQQVVKQDWQKCIQAQRLDLNAWQDLDAARQRQLLSAWMKGQGQYRPALGMVQRLIQEVIYARPDAQAVLFWNEHYYVRYQGWIHCLLKEEYQAQAIHQRDQCQFEFGQHFQQCLVDYQIQTAELGLSRYLLGQTLDLTARQGGEKIHLQGRVGKWPLKKAIQDAQIFPWQRHLIQILSIDNVMLGVFTPKGFWLAESAYCEAGGWLPSETLSSL